LKNDIKTIKEKRKEKETELIKNKQPVYYPSFDSLKMEDTQPAPHLLFTIADESGAVVRRIKAPAKKGMNRIAWDFRHESTGPVSFASFDESLAFSSPDLGHMALPGDYKVSLSKFEDGIYSTLTDPVAFKAVPLAAGSLQTGDKKAMGVFTAKVAELRRVVSGTEEYRREQVNKLNYLKATLQKTGSIPLELSQQFASIEKRLDAAGTALNGDRTKSGREFETVPSINQRLGRITGALWSSTSADPAAYQDDYDLVEKKFRPVYQEVKSIGEEIKKLEAELDKLKAPYTPGRLPEFK
jgi:hypothetical protein